MHTHTPIYIYIYVHILGWIYTLIYAYTHTPIYIYIYVHILEWIYTLIYAYTHTYIYIYIYVHILGWIKGFTIFWYVLDCDMHFTCPKQFNQQKVPTVVGSKVVGTITLCALLLHVMYDFKAAQMNLSNKVKSGRLRTVDSEVMLQAIKANPTSGTQGVSSEFSISKSSVLCHIHNLSELCIILPKYCKTLDWSKY